MTILQNLELQDFNFVGLDKKDIWYQPRENHHYTVGLGNMNCKPRAACDQKSGTGQSGLIPARPYNTGIV